MMNTPANQMNDDMRSDRLKMFINHTGSVIQLLQETFDEDILVECLGQGINRTNRKIWNDISDEENILVRTVFLKGKQSGKRYVYASSYIRVEHLPEEFIKELMNSEAGIGDLLEKYKFLTTRKIVSTRKVFNRLIHCVFPEQETITERQYIIYLQQTPVILITEYYPGEYF